MNDVINSQIITILSIAGSVTGIVAITVTFLMNKVKSVKYNSELQQVQLDQLRSSLEKELYKINDRLMQETDRWKDINHLLIRKEYTEDKPITLNKQVTLNNFLRSNGLTNNDLTLDKDLVFVLTPFHESFSMEYETIRNICTSVGFKCVRGDEKYFKSDIFPEMLKLIVKSNLIIANINGKNPNVLYELGICQALDKPVILVARNPEKLPIDIKSKRFLIYDSPNDLTSLLKNELIKLLKEQVETNEDKIANKIIKVNDWEAQTKKNNFQWADYKEVDLNGYLLESISCSIYPHSNYLRFGFKLLDRNSTIFGSGGILSPDNNVLLHIGRDLNNSVIGATFYKGAKLEKNVAALPGFYLDQKILIKLTIDNRNLLQFFVNENEIYKTTINYDSRERILIMAWGDENEFKLSVKDIELKLR